MQRPVKDQHPVTDFRGATFTSKRGYFPPPVGHLRRVQTHPKATDPQLQGSDQPILNNFLPGDGFYVHDVWDGSGFVFQTGGDVTTVVQPLASDKTEAEPTINNTSLIQYSKQTSEVTQLTGGGWLLI